MKSVAETESDFSDLIKDTRFVKVKRNDTFSVKLPKRHRSPLDSMHPATSTVDIRNQGGN